MLVKAAEGFILCEGGFGTLDELFESLVLIQTGTIRHFPVVLVGTAHWDGLRDWIEAKLIDEQLISPGDVTLLSLTDDAAEAVKIVHDCYLEHCTGDRGAGDELMELRDLPSVDELAREVDDPLAVDAARTVLDRARDEIRAGGAPGDLRAAVEAEIAAARAPSLRRVLNATGVIVHTNLGRAPLAPAALERVREVGAGYSNLEYSLDEGARGSRQTHLAAALLRLTGAEAALVVNNNAGAMLLALAALAEGREVLVSRGELIEIGDGFRIPDVLARSGARLVEVGTTNRTRAEDYERAIGAGHLARPARPPVELPRRRVHRPTVARRGRCDRPAARSAAGRRPRLRQPPAK